MVRGDEGEERASLLLRACLCLRTKPITTDHQPLLTVRSNFTKWTIYCFNIQQFPEMCFVRRKFTSVILSLWTLYETLLHSPSVSLIPVAVCLPGLFVSSCRRLLYNDSRKLDTVTVGTLPGKGQRRSQRLKTTTVQEVHCRQTCVQHHWSLSMCTWLLVPQWEGLFTCEIHVSFAFTVWKNIMPHFN